MKAGTQGAQVGIPSDHDIRLSRRGCGRRGVVDREEVVACQFLVNVARRTPSG